MARKPKGDWKDRLGVVYSTSDDFSYDYDAEDEAETVGAAKQKLVVSLDKKRRGGKQVTLVSGYVGKEEDLKAVQLEKAQNESSLTVQLNNNRSF